MAQIYIANNTQNVRYVGGQMIPPGESRPVEEALVPPHLRPGAKPAKKAEPEVDPIGEILKHSIGELEDILPSLSAEELALLEARESDADKPRKGALEAIAAARLALAAGE